MAAYYSFIHRLISIPLSTEDYKQELLTIKHIAVANGYRCSMIDKLISKHKRNNNNNTENPNIEMKYSAADFGTILNHTLRNEMAKNNVTVSFRTNNKLGSILKERKNNKVKKEDKTGVYQINCDNCPKYYIGQTTRSFKKRFKEHIPASSSNNSKSSFANHLINENHNYSNFDKNLEVLHVHNKKGSYLNCLEEFEIYSSMKTDRINVLNEQTSFQSNIIYDAAIRVAKQRSRQEQKHDRHTTDNGRGANSPV